VADAGITDAGFVMVREGASLAALRAILAKALLNTEFGPTAAMNAYSFYLHDGATAVAAEEESYMQVFDHVPGLVLVPSGTGGASAGATPPAVDAGVEIDDLFAQAQAEATAQRRSALSAALSLDDVLGDAQLLLRFKRITFGSGLGEENSSFLKELRDVRTAAAALPDKAAAWALALPRLRSAATVYLTRSTAMKLEVQEVTRSAAVAAFAAASKDASGGVEALLGALAAAEKEVSAACEAKLSELRSAVGRAAPNKSVGKARRTVVVVGGGIAGSLIARWFDRHHSDKLDLVLVDPKEYHELTLMMLRAVVQTGDNFQRRVRCKHTEYVRNGTFIMDSCQEVAPDHIRVGSSAEESYVVPFDFLILSTGSVWTTDGIKTASPSMEYRIKQYDGERRRVATAQRVLIIGSGVVGNELCGEIIDAFPNKEVIMVGRTTLLRRAGPEAHRILSAHWAEKGVKCYYNEEMLPLKDGDTHYTTAKGTRIPVDGTRAFWCTGRATPNSAFLRKHFPSALDDYDYIKIDEHCRVNGVARGNIFACGDCTFGSAHPGGDRGTVRLPGSELGPFAFRHSPPPPRPANLPTSIPGSSSLASTCTASSRVRTWWP
jgi:NADH dehydrogenase FAD-containing subunit